MESTIWIFSCVLLVILDYAPRNVNAGNLNRVEQNRMKMFDLEYGEKLSSIEGGSDIQSRHKLRAPGRKIVSLSTRCSTDRAVTIPAGYVPKDNNNIIESDGTENTVGGPNGGQNGQNGLDSPSNGKNIGYKVPEKARTPDHYIDDA